MASGLTISAFLPVDYDYCSGSGWQIEEAKLFCAQGQNEMAINLRMYISPNIIKVMKRLQMNIVLFGQRRPTTEEGEKSNSQELLWYSSDTLF
ncbi:hypothetical protein MTR_7g008960 [Medicago truncatula]|uniref:Uncharacterized protein n=1 Tax=Medicago truncatula TaxID=3880 RepID=G7KYR2_MEDTR|nr:hypothetical protein MTR_7g008960 [Medicago truncatula]